eukprot:3010590-Rhodomonas_salina.1
MTEYSPPKKDAAARTQWFAADVARRCVATPLDLKLLGSTVTSDEEKKSRPASAHVRGDGKANADVQGKRRCLLPRIRSVESKLSERMLRPGCLRWVPVLEGLAVENGLHRTLRRSCARSASFASTFAMDSNAATSTGIINMHCRNACVAAMLTFSAQYRVFRVLRESIENGTWDTAQLKNTSVTPVRCPVLACWLWKRKSKPTRCASCLRALRDVRGCCYTAHASRHPTPEVPPSYRPTRALHPEIQYKKPLFQYNLYQECGFLHWISGCARCPALTSAMPLPSGKAQWQTSLTAGRLSSYALAMRCPVLGYDISLLAWYAIPDTDTVHHHTLSLCDVRYLKVHRPTLLCLRPRATPRLPSVCDEIAYGATNLCYQPTRLLSDVRNGDSVRWHMAHAR